MEKERREVSADGLERYFEAVGVHLKDISLLFVWDADETKIGSPKKQRPPQVSFARETPPGTTTVAAVRDDAQLTLFPTISAFGDLIPPLIIAKNQTYEK
jgi:hypothetical protein